VRVEFERSGGIAGHTMAVKIDAATLAPEHRSVADALLAGEVDRTVAREAAPAPMGADQFEYRLRVRHGNRSRTYRWTAGAVPPDAEALVAELTDRARGA